MHAVEKEIGLRVGLFCPDVRRSPEELEHPLFELLSALCGPGNVTSFYRGSKACNSYKYGVYHVCLGAGLDKVSMWTQYTLRAIKLAKWHKLDLIYCNDYKLAFLLGWGARVLRIPMVLQVGVDWNAYDSYSRDKRKVAVLRCMRRLAVRFARSVIVLARHLAGQVRCYGVEPRVLYPFINLERFSWPRLLVPGRTSEIVYLGRLSPIKGAQYVIESVPYLIKSGLEFHVTIAGGDPGGGQRSVRKRILDTIDSEGLKDYVTVVGHIPHSEVSGLLKKARFCVMPSLTEGFHFALLECWAMGIPIVASRIPFYEEIVDSSVGRICSLDAEELSRAMIELLRMDDGTLEDMRLSARKKAEGIVESAKRHWRGFFDELASMV